MNLESVSSSAMPNSWDPMYYTTHEILQARILECVAVPSSKGSSQPRDEPRSPTLQADSLPSEPLGKLKNAWVGSLSFFQQIFLTQESNRGLLHCREILYWLSYQGIPWILKLLVDPYMTWSCLTSMDFTSTSKEWNYTGADIRANIRAFLQFDVVCTQCLVYNRFLCINQIINSL